MLFSYLLTLFRAIYISANEYNDFAFFTGCFPPPQLLKNLHPAGEMFSGSWQRPPKKVRYG
ncbi:hypothetical protein CAter282_0703 [Collimonas arenae]|uniref:Uncharacterized protein n=1 Tax=Collimonas arenae TaxID=279058 RepID=A0A127QEL7_9BURK|nr:hypothetical protein [Collimonas arenae]AMO98620.1 hypothetical protein CAter10_0756 [Collimonas arenae]AMP08507.1 hypothetical protein CAter282_0703 [Collimonas arenae]